MKKILILTSFGKTDQPEEAKWMHLYFCSLKKNVIPYYDTKVILLNNYKIESCENSLTNQQIKKYGLENTVIVKSIYEMDLSEKAINFIKELGPATSVGAKLNLLFDYSKRNNFFDADWVFHIDGDVEFQENFHQLLNGIDNFPHDEKIINLSGDTHNTHIVTPDAIYTFNPPARVDIYNDETIPEPAFVCTKQHVVKTKHNSQSQVPVESGSHFHIHPQKLKVRNDFVGLNRAFIEKMLLVKPINWIMDSYDVGRADWNGSEHLLTDIDKELIPFWKTGVTYTFMQDKGGAFEHDIKSGIYFTPMRFELPPVGKMTIHYGGGWGYYDGTSSMSNGSLNFFDAICTKLPKFYSDYREVWESEFPGIQEIDSLDNELYELQNQINEKTTLRNTKLAELRKSLQDITT